MCCLAQPRTVKRLGRNGLERWLLAIEKLDPKAKRKSLSYRILSLSARSSSNA
jgi:hypothetical protein